ncbi:MAG: sugar phosphate isomerase/epimerase [Opitutaceae bacterium]
MLSEMARHGFEWVELSHGIRVSLVPGILKALGEGIVRVSSVHNFCPLPTGFTSPAPNIYMPSAGDHREHAQWLRHTKRTIDFAKQVGARVAVLHLGEVGFFWFNPVKKLRRHERERGEAFSPEAPEYQRLLAKTTTAIHKRMAPYWARVKASLEEIIPYAEEGGVRLGLENRERIDELPLDAGFGELLGGLSRQGIAGYWHDAGHAQIKQRLGLLNHEQHLAQNAPHLLGFHLHDVDATGRDHQPLGSGTIDFAMLSRFFRPEHLLVLEYGPKVAGADVSESRRHLESLLPSA